MRPRTRTFVFPLCLFALAWSIPVQAALVRTLSYQGSLAQADGTPVPDGEHELTFRLWDAQQTGTQLWQETDTVTVTGGMFNATLGENSPLEVDFAQELWLGISVGADPELTPRTRLASSPRAVHAEVASFADSVAVRTYYAEDPAEVQALGIGETVISTWTWNAVPEGDVLITVTCMGKALSNNTASGKLYLKANDVALPGRVGTHALNIHTGINYAQVSVLGQLSGFTGGPLTLQLMFDGDLTATAVQFGHGPPLPDPAFGRRCSVIAGL